ncbi:MAG: HNH endonuclease family protein, partial [Motiliproteus sp.]
RITEQKVVDFLLKSDADTARFPSDQEFTTAWLTRTSYQNLAQYKIRAILGALDIAFETSKSESLALPDTLTIEHVLPVTWQTNWPLGLDDPDNIEEKLSSTESRNKILHSFGNLTLITGSLNPALSNGSWKDKKPELIKFSKLNLNRYFHDCDHWDEDAIIERGKGLLAKAQTIWAYPVVGKDNE